MTRTKVVSLHSHIALRVAFVALIAMCAFLYSSLEAHAQYRMAPAGSKSPTAHQMEMPSRMAPAGSKSSTANQMQMPSRMAKPNNQGNQAFSQKDLENIMDRIADLEKKKQELLEKLEKQKGNKATSTSPFGGNWQDRFCKENSGFNLPNDLRKRICDRWKPATTTPPVAITPKIKVLHPNGGTLNLNKDNSVTISWQTTPGITKVDIDLTKTGSGTASTTSIAKNVEGDTPSRGRIKNGGECYGEAMNGLWRWACDSTRGVNTYRWKNAPEGEGYKIVITGKSGTTTVSDSSDNTFTLKKFSPQKKRVYLRASADSSTAVLGAETTFDDQIDMAMNRLVGNLVDLSLALRN